MSDVEVKVFMEKEYPKYKDNMTLGRFLYQKSQGKNSVVRALGSPFEVKIKEIKTLPSKSKVVFRGLVAEIQLQTYLGCPECRKRLCDHGKGSKEIIISKLLIGDDTDMIWSSVFEMDGGVTEGCVVEVVGVVREWNKERDVSIYEIRVVDEAKVLEVKPVKGSDEDKVARIVKFIDTSLRAKLDMVLLMCENEGVSFDLVKKCVDVNYDVGEVFSRKGMKYGKD